MKKIFILLLLAGTTAHAQVPVPHAYSSEAKINYVRSWEPKKAVTNTEVVPGLSVSEVKQSTSFVDGLGTTIQTVIKQATPLGNDMVSYKTFDDWGREVQQYLPTPSRTNEGYFKTNPFEEQKQYYSSGALNNNQYFGEQYYYGLTIPEPSPLSRPEVVMAAGNSWVGNETGVNSHYLVNTEEDNVRVWRLNNNQLIGDRYYEKGMLLKNISTDENNSSVVEFTDKSGKLILKKVQAATEPDNGYDGWLCTYYIYDDFGNLSYILQPRAVKISSVNGWQVGSEILDEFSFHYQYDSRNRMIMKKVPGAAEVWMVYDRYNRLVLTQDGNLRDQHKWLYTKYDILNRPIYTGFYTNPEDWSHVQHAVIDFYTNDPTVHYEILENNSDVGYTLDRSFPEVTQNEILSITYYDDYQWTRHYDSKYQEKDNSFDISLRTPNDNNFPFPQSLQASTSTSGLVTGTITYSLENQGISSTSRMISVVFYDDKARLIQTKSDNVTHGFDITTTRYSFSGLPIKTLLYQENKAGDKLKYIWQLTTMDYDVNSRLLKITKAIKDDQVSEQHAIEKVIVENHYDELGQLKKKRLGLIDITHTLEELNYKYNIRGWIESINKDFLAENNGHYFGMEFAYDNIHSGIGPEYTKPQLNGNIAGLTWMSRGDITKRRYNFSYDRSNRLLEAVFIQDNGDSWNHNVVNYDVKMGDGVHHLDANDNEIGIDYRTAYDENGNILQMQQWGLKLNQIIQIDDLHYHYQLDNKSNKLRNVVDGTNDENSKLGDFKTLASHPQWPKTDVYNTDYYTDYSHDLNGNLTSDNNKAISAIRYNYLNLPYLIIIDGKGTIEYGYDATGNKLSKTTIDNSDPSKTVTTKTLYLGGSVYESKTTNPAAASDYENKLQFISTEEGRVRPLQVDPQTVMSPSAPASMAFDYFVKDHLGNVRAVLTDEVKVDKYPVASLESNPDKAAIESSIYTITTGQIVDKPVWMSDDYTNGDNGIGTIPADATFEAANSAKVYRLNGNNESTKTGLGITLKVMAGDKIDIFGKSFWHDNNVSGSQANYPVTVTQLLSGFLGTPGEATQSHGIVREEDINQTPGIDLINMLLSNQDNGVPASSTIPKAYINYLFFDEQFKCTGGGFSKVETTPDTYKQHHSQLQDLAIPKNGYVYIYCSNESPVDVFFDNLQVVHTRGPILEETHYYPFGLTMAGISSKAAGGVENKIKYNGIEFDKDLDINTYEANFRDLDPQTGRWWQIDPETDKMFMWSTYASNYDNPILYADQNGDKPTCCGEAEARIERQLRDVSSGKMNAKQLSEHLNIQANTDAVAVGIGVLAIIFGPEEVVGGLRLFFRASENETPAPKSQELQKAEARADKLSKTDRSGKDFTRAGKDAVKDVNKAKNEGKMKCEDCGKETVNGKKHTEGETPPGNEAHVDHIDPKSNGGSGTPNNGQVLCRDCNLKKGSKTTLPVPDPVP